eukprot:gene22245-biopygen30928
MCYRYGGDPLIKLGSKAKKKYLWTNSHFTPLPCRSNKPSKLAKILALNIKNGVAPDPSSTVSQDLSHMDHFDTFGMRVGHHAFLTGIQNSPHDSHTVNLRGFLKLDSYAAGCIPLSADYHNSDYISHVLNKLMEEDLAQTISCTDVTIGYHGKSHDFPHYCVTVQLKSERLAHFVQSASTNLGRFAVLDKKRQIVKGAPYFSHNPRTAFAVRVRVATNLSRETMWTQGGQPRPEDNVRLCMRALVLYLVYPTLLMHGLYAKAFHHKGNHPTDTPSPENTQEDRRKRNLAESENLELPPKAKNKTGEEVGMETSTSTLLEPPTTVGQEPPRGAHTPILSPNAPINKDADYNEDHVLKDLELLLPAHGYPGTQFPLHLLALTEVVQRAHDVLRHPLLQLLNFNVGYNSNADCVNLYCENDEHKAELMRALPIHITIPDCGEIYLTAPEPPPEAIERSVSLRLAHGQLQWDSAHLNAMLKAMTTQLETWTVKCLDGWAKEIWEPQLTNALNGTSGSLPYKIIPRCIQTMEETNLPPLHHVYTPRGIPHTLLTTRQKTQLQQERWIITLATPKLATLVQNAFPSTLVYQHNGSSYTTEISSGDAEMSGLITHERRRLMQESVQTKYSTTVCKILSLVAIRALGNFRTWEAMDSVPAQFLNYTSVMSYVAMVMAIPDADPAEAPPAAEEEETLVGLPSNLLKLMDEAVALPKASNPTRGPNPSAANRKMEGGPKHPPPPSQGGTRQNQMAQGSRHPHGAW